LSRRTRRPRPNLSASRALRGPLARRALLVAALLPVPALAGRPLTTEDASTLGDGACQVESWVDRARDDLAEWHLEPACAFLGVEWQAGAARSREEGRSATTAVFVQGKHAFRSVEDGPWGIGLVAGLARAPQREARNGWGDPYVIVPLSFAFGGDRDRRWLVHLNAGTLRMRHPARDVALWGAAVEAPAIARLVLVAEAFGENASKPWLRAGGRYAFAGGFAVDLTYVARSGGTPAERFASLGFHWESGALLP
jgi:hypothetical protein